MPEADVDDVILDRPGQGRPKARTGQPPDGHDINVKEDKEGDQPTHPLRFQATLGHPSPVYSRRNGLVANHRGQSQESLFWSAMTGHRFSNRARIPSRSASSRGLFY